MSEGEKSASAVVVTQRQVMKGLRQLLADMGVHGDVVRKMVDEVVTIEIAKSIKALMTQGGVERLARAEVNRYLAGKDYSPYPRDVLAGIVSAAVKAEVERAIASAVRITVTSPSQGGCREG